MQRRTIFPCGGSDYFDFERGVQTRINNTNSNTPFESITLAEAIAKRDCLRSKIRVYRKLHAAAAISQDRYSTKEIKYIRCVDVVKLQKIIDDLSKDYREIDTKMQGLNWTVDLLE